MRPCFHKAVSITSLKRKRPLFGILHRLRLPGPAWSLFTLAQIRKLRYSRFPNGSDMATDTINTGNNVAAEEVLPKPWGLQISYEYRDVLHNKLVDYFPCRSILLQRIAMFTTFPASTVRQDQDDNDGRFGPVSNTRPRRHQVSRACGWCRALRIKCDDQIPCRNCTAKRRKCEQKGANELRTFSLAVKSVYDPMKRDK